MYILNRTVKGKSVERRGRKAADTGKTIAHKDAERVTGQENIIEQAKSNPALAPLVAIVSRKAKGEEGLATYTFQGQESVIAYAPVKTTG